MHFLSLKASNMAYWWAAPWFGAFTLFDLERNFTGCRNLVK